MSFSSTNTFSFDEPTTPELPGSLSDETIWVASSDDHALLGDSPRSAGSLELSPRPTQLMDWDAFPTLVDTFDGRTTLATRDCEVQQHTPPIDSSANSNTVALVVEMPIQAELTPLYASDTTYGVYENSGDDQSPLLESRDTGASSHLNFRKPVPDLEQDHQLAIIPTETTTYIPQRVYRPRGEAEQEKYVHKANLSSPITFYVEKPFELGIALEEILKKNSRRLIDGDDLVFQGCSRSISLRIEWPGYRPWTCQLPIRDYRKTPGPITRAKLAKNLANCIRRFIQKTHRDNMKADPNPMWRISADGIKFEDLILVSLNHVSQGSWQPQLRLRRQMLGRA